MPSRSKAPIYHMYARVAFKKRKVVHERTKWIVSVFDNPHDIMTYDSKTMTRLQDELYGSTKSERHVIIREVFDLQKISDSNLTIDEHKSANQRKVQEA
jgi:hypothetical protein